MLKNNNNNVIKKLSRLGLKNNKLRNRFAGIVIILAAFLLAVSTISIYNATESLKSVANFQGLYQNVSEDNLKSLRSNTDVEKLTVNQSIGTAHIGENTLKLFYGDENYLGYLSYDFDKGGLPANKDEIAIEKGFDKNLNIGDSIDLEYRNYVSGEMQKGSFKITGIFSQTHVNANQNTFISIFSKDMIASDPDLSSENPEVILSVADPNSYSGKEMEAKIDEIATLAGMSTNDAFPNTAYIAYNSNFTETFLPIFLIAIVVLIACSLVIYNIFYISIIQKVKEYGQLRTIGTTKKQVRQMVYYEGIILAVRYVPVGVIIAFFSAYIASPKIWIIIADIIIAVICAIITFFTIIFSVRKPAKMASEASPIDAAKYTGISSGKKKTKHSEKRITARSLGIQNLTQNKKKAFLTFASLILSGVMLIVIATLMGSFKPESILYNQDVYSHRGSYNISFNRELLSPKIWYNDLQIDNPISDDLEAKILEIPEVDYIYKNQEIVVYIDGISEENGQTTLANLDETPYGLTEDDIVDGEITSIYTNSSSVVINQGTDYYQIFELDYNIGDKVLLTLMDGDKKVEKEFTISGIVNAKNMNPMFYTSSDMIETLITENPNMSFEIVTKEGYLGEATETLKALVREDDKVVLKIFSQDLEGVRLFTSRTTLIAYCLTALIALFALVNLINTTISNIITRKYEIGVLQSVGLSNDQMVTMLNTEGFAYTFGSFLLSVTFGCIIGLFVSSSISAIPSFSYIRFNFPVVVIAIYFAIIAVLQIIITFIMKKYLLKATVVERLSQK